MSGAVNSPVWQALAAHRDVIRSRALADIVLSDPKRLDTCEIVFEGMRLSYALNHVAPETVKLLADLARTAGIEDWRERMWRGDILNTGEDRAVLHIALRQQGEAPIMASGTDVIPLVRATRRRLADFVADLRTGRYLGATGKQIRQVVNIGIGGSDLGPRLAARALSGFATGPRVHFVANADAYELTRLFTLLDPEETLFIIVSKTFTTLETLLNARTARQWMQEKLGKDAMRHFVAVSVNVPEAGKFGIAEERVFPIWDWVGGRFSLWSAVGLALELEVGTDNFDAMLRGAAAMDTHFRTAPPEKNLPVMLAMLSIWSRDFLGRAAHAVLPYSDRLRDLPRYLQQLEMESCGKTAARDGGMAAAATAPLLFGESGTVGQHGFHQWLHQGSDIVSADFIAVAGDDLGFADHHQALLGNLTAQACALAFGKTSSSARDFYPGNRGSNLLTLRRLDPYTFGMLLALYEHKVFTQSVVWGINPFDQPGVELGKRMARILAEKDAPADKAGQFMADLYARFGA